MLSQMYRSRRPIVAVIVGLSLLPIQFTEVGHCTPPSKPTGVTVTQLIDDPEGLAITFHERSISNSELRLLSKIRNARELSIEEGQSINDKNSVFLGQLFNLRILEIKASPLTDEGLAFLTNLKKLERLKLRGSKISDAGLRHLRNLSQLKHLELISCPNITGSGYEHVHIGLRVLNCQGRSSGNDADLASLTRFSNLEELNLSYTNIGDDALLHVGQMAALRTLNLKMTRNVTDKGLSHLSELDDLYRFSVSGRLLTDSSLRHLHAMKNLAFLRFYGSNISDAGLKHIGQLKNLKELHVGRVKASNEAIANLKEKLPNTRVNVHK